MQELRKAKKELKRERKSVIKRFGKGSAPEKAISQQWFKLMHEHANVRRALEKRDHNKFCSHQQRRFKKDPMKFGKSLFEKRSAENPLWMSLSALITSIVFTMTKKEANPSVQCQK